MTSYAGQSVQAHSDFICNELLPNLVAYADGRAAPRRACGSGGHGHTPLSLSLACRSAARSAQVLRLSPWMA